MRQARRRGREGGEGGGVFNERQDSEAGGNRENNKKWTEGKEPAGVVA